MGSFLANIVNRATRTRKTIAFGDLQTFRPGIEISRQTDGFHVFYPNERGMDPYRKVKEIARYELISCITAGRKALDVGSGSFYGAAMIAERAKSVVGTEISSWVVQLARFTWRKVKNLSCRYVTDLAQLGNIRFEAVTLINVIEHMTESEAEVLLKKIASDFMDKDGIFVLSTPRSRRAITGSYENPDHKKEYGEQELIDLLERAGLRIDKRYFQTMRSIKPGTESEVDKADRGWFIWVLRKV